MIAVGASLPEFTFSRLVNGHHALHPGRRALGQPLGDAVQIIGMACSHQRIKGQILIGAASSVEPGPSRLQL